MLYITIMDELLEHRRRILCNSHDGVGFRLLIRVYCRCNFDDFDDFPMGLAAKENPLGRQVQTGPILSNRNFVCWSVLFLLSS